MKCVGELITPSIVWGRWHLRKIMVVLVIIWLPTSFHLLNMIFYRADTDYWCAR